MIEKFSSLIKHQFYASAAIKVMKLILPLNVMDLEIQNVPIVDLSKLFG